MAKRSSKQRNKAKTSWFDTPLGEGERDKVTKLFKQISKDFVFDTEYPDSI